MVSQQYQLVMRTGPTMGKAYGLGKNEITIGRDPSNDIVLNDSEVSRKHARLIYQDDTHTLEDLGSTNGTFVNGQRIMGPQELRAGDTLLLGENVTVTYELLQIDEEGTVAVRPRPVEARSAPAPQYPAPQQERQAPPPPQPQTSYSRRVPPGPVMDEAPGIPPQAEKSSTRRTWLYAGCGCLVLVLIIFAVALIAFDQLNLWCVPPFDVFGGSILGYTCP